jgi:acetyl-CoA carboxylase biotin carboxyl carrier protein
MDLKEVERVLELMKEHDLVEVELEDTEAGTRMRLRKAGPETNSHPVLTPALALPATQVEPATVPSPVPAAPAVAEAQADEDRANLTEVPSPMVGTYYRASSPDAEPFVEVGDKIEAETVVCIIEAMKVMNEIKAEVAGEIVEILVQNGEAVEFGQPIFLVRTD